MAHSDHREVSDHTEDINWTSSNSCIWIPPAGNHATIAAPPDNILPFPTVAIMANNFQLTQLPENLLIVVSNGAQLEAVFSAAERANIVVWLWWCAELTAQRVEDYFPAIYGRPTAEAITEAFKDGAGRQTKTTLCIEAEAMLGFPNVLA